MSVIRGYIETELLSSMDLGCTLESRDIGFEGGNGLPLYNICIIRTNYHRK